ncbi:MAG: PKD domain-containing protein [Bacteroidota bacterium]
MKTSKTIFFKVIFLSLFYIGGYSQDTTYIDPGNAGDAQEDGTIEHPYDSWDDINLADNSVYLFRRGTVLEQESTMGLYSLNDVTIGAYGTGDRPRLEIPLVYIKNGQDLVLKDVELYVNSSRGILFGEDNPNRRMRIDNVVVHGIPNDEPDFGIYGQVQDLTIKDTEIYDINLDGIFLNNSFGIDIIGTYIHHVNLDYHENPTTASGDGIQFMSSDDILIKETTIDRSGTGRKFNVIFTNTNDNITVNNIVLEDNHFIGPGEHDQGGASIYIGVESAEIRRNKIEGALVGVYTHSPDIMVNNNLFITNQTAIDIASHGADIYNNVFYDNNRSIYSWLRPSSIKNNIIYLTDPSQTSLEVADCEVSNNLQNISSESSNFDAGTISDPQFVDVAQENFYIEESSQAINSGVDVGVAYDYAENPVPCSGVPDIGAFEYQGDCESNSNNRPVADAGSDQTVDENTQVDLDGSESYDPDQDPLSYSWSSPEGITLSDASVAQPHFTAPDVETETMFLFELTVSDGSVSSSSDSVYVTVRNLEEENHAPVADAGENLSATEASHVELNGANSYDPDQDSLYYHWESPEMIALSDSTAVQPELFIPKVDSDTTFYFYLTVSDNNNASSTDTTKIFVEKETTSVFNHQRGGQSSFAIYPNPVRNRLNVQSKINEQIEDVQFYFYSIEGKLELVREKRGLLSGDGIELDVSRLPSGVYIFRVQSGNKILYRNKLIKQ